MLVVKMHADNPVDSFQHIKDMSSVLYEVIACDVNNKLEVDRFNKRGYEIQFPTKPDLGIVEAGSLMSMIRNSAPTIIEDVYVSGEEDAATD